MTCEGCMRLKRREGSRIICRRFVQAEKGGVIEDLRELDDAGCEDKRVYTKPVIDIPSMSDAKSWIKGKKTMPKSFGEIVEQWKAGTITTADAAHKCRCSATTFLKYAKERGYSEEEK